MNGTVTQSHQMWDIINSARIKAEGNLDKEMNFVGERLYALEPEGIAAFEQDIDNALEDANSWGMWAAAYIINGGASDDGFLYFRGWFLAQGEAIFKKAVADAESLSDYPGIESDNCECEEILYIPSRVYRSKTGCDLPPNPTLSVTKGQPWEEDELEKRFPRLWAAFGEA